MASHEKSKYHDRKGHHPTQSIDSGVRWITSPMETWDEDVESFSPRHEASTLELFFDLFFVANLATFTQYHAITNHHNFWSYIGFFGVLWMTWFHVVCFDTRFSVDSVWERVCKVVHFCTFVGFALVGYKFNLLQKSTPNWIYCLLCWTLFLSRIWLALQYLVTALFCSSRKNRYLGLTVPLVANTFVFLLAAAVYGGLYAGFSEPRSNLAGFIAAIYVVIGFEFVGTLSISCIWRKLSFKATHIAERLSLLGLIIIGEGVIGTTKTIIRIMGKNGVYVEGVSLIFCIILILVFMWILYFDNLPKYRFGTVAQQFWMALHLPLHLAILGVVEGSQHIALARYIYYSAEKLSVSTWYACVQAHLDGPALSNNLTKAITYFKLYESAQANLSLPLVFDQIYLLGNQSGICATGNTTNLNNGMAGIPVGFTQFFQRAIGAMFQAFDLDIPTEGEVYALRIAARSWKVVYTYYWSAILLLLLCLTVSALLADKGLRVTWLRVEAMAARAVMIVFSIAVLAVGLRHESFLNKYVGSAWILPTVALQLWVVCWGDRLSKVRLRRKRSYDRVVPSDSSDSGDGEREREGERDGFVVSGP